MANYDFFTVTSNWTAIEANGVDIEEGDFGVFSQSSKRVGFIKSDVVPTTQNGVINFEEPDKSFTVTLEFGDKLYAKTNTGTAEIGVIPM